MEYLKLAGIFIGASAFWKALEALLHFGLQKKLKKAELRNLNAEANEKVIGNWIAWSDKMEERIQELEKDNLAMKKDNREMKQVIVKQRERISDLEVYTEKLEHKLKKYEEKK